MTLTEAGGSDTLKINDEFETPYDTDIERFKVLEINPSAFGSHTAYRLERNHRDGTTSVVYFYGYEIDSSDFPYSIKVEDKAFWEHQTYTPTCWHSNTKKVILFTSGYTLCLDCGKDLGTLSDTEFLQAVKEQFGGKESKRAPEMGQIKRKRR